MDSGDETRGNYNSTKAKTRLESRQDYAKVAGGFFAIAGFLLTFGSIAATSFDDFPRLALFNTGLACFIWAGHMVIGWGATTGHLAVFRLVEIRSLQGMDKMDTAISLEARNGEIIGDVLEDDLRRKRDSR